MFRTSPPRGVVTEQGLTVGKTSVRMDVPFDSMFEQPDLKAQNLVQEHAKRRVFKWYHAFFFVFFVLCMWTDVLFVASHPVHTGMTADESTRLCWKALFAGPYAGSFLPCVPEKMTESALGLVIPVLLFLWFIKLFISRKTLSASICLCTFLIVWLGTGCASLAYWK